MDFTNNFRLPYSFYKTPLANSASNNSGKNIASAEVIARCDNRTNQQTSYNDGNGPSDRSVHFNFICSSTNQQDTTGVQLATPEHFCGNNKVQNGGLSFTTLDPSGKRLHDEVGFEGRLLFHPNSRGTQEVSSVHLQRSPIRISVPTIRVVNGATDIYESPETCDRLVETTRITSDCLPRRSAVVASRSQGTSTIISRSVSNADRLGIPCQEGKMLDRAGAISGLFRCSDQLSDHDLGSTSNKVTRITGRSTELKGETNMFYPRTVSPSRTNDPNVQDRDGVCSPSLPELAKTAHQVGSQIRNSSSKTTDLTHAGIDDGLGMVDFSEANGGELGIDNGTETQHHNPNRCIPSRLGSCLSRGEDGESLEHSGTRRSHQCVRIEGSTSGYSVIPEEGRLSTSRKASPLADGQHYRSGFKRGGTKSNQLTQLALKIWELCQSHKIMLIAQYIPGIENVEADAESRQMNARTEWALAKHLFVKIRTRYYTPEVDLFASRLNHQVPLYVARRPDPGAMAIDAFTLDWSQWTSFIHPPIVLLGRILLKIRQDKATALLIAPAWLDSRGTRHCWRCWSTGQPNFQHHRQQSSSHSIRQLFIRCGRH